MKSSALEITMETFDISSIMKRFMRYVAHLMFAILFENNKTMMLVMWLEYLLKALRNN